MAETPGMVQDRLRAQVARLEGELADERAAVKGMREEGCAAVGLVENIFNGLTSPQAMSRRHCSPLREGASLDVQQEMADACADVLFTARRCGCQGEKAALVAALERIRDHEQNDDVKDAAAYDRMVEGYRDAARAVLSGEGKAWEQVEPERLAQLFHEAYERLAPDFGYKTRDASAVPWEQVPDPNKRLMIATCSAALAAMKGE